MEQVTHIVVSGAESMGKTTLIHMALGKLKSEGVVVSGTSEGADRGLPFPPAMFDTDPETYEHAAVASFSSMTACGLLQRKARNVIHDRSPFDYAAYHRVKHAEAERGLFDSILNATASFLRRRRSLVLLVTNPAEENAKPFDDNYRCLDAWWRPQIAPAMRRLYDEHGIPVLEVDDEDWSVRAFDAYHSIRHFITGQDKPTRVSGQVRTWLRENGIETSGMRMVGSRSPDSFRIPKTHSDIDIEVYVASFDKARQARAVFEGQADLVSTVCQANVHLTFIPEDSKPFPV